MPPGLFDKSWEIVTIGSINVLVAKSAVPPTPLKVMGTRTLVEATPPRYKISHRER
jgi:hypothetical protein